MLVLDAGAHAIVSSDLDLLILHPWRNISALRPAEHLAAGGARRLHTGGFACRDARWP